MFTPPPPPVVVVQKKSGMGCFGIGCVVLIVAILLVGGIVALMSYLTFSKVGAMTSTVPVTTQSFDGGDQLYQGTEEKLTEFQQAQQQGRPASIELSADELNTLIARDSDFTNNHIHAFVTMTGDRAKIEASFPTDMIPLSVLKGRFVNGEAEFSPSFNPTTKELTFRLYGLKIGSEAIPVGQLSTIETQLNPTLNAQLRMAPNTQGVLDHAQTIEIRNGKLEIEMK